MIEIKKIRKTSGGENVKKPVWLKKAIIKHNIVKLTFKCFYFFKSDKKLGENNILVTQLDGIGDGVIRLGLLKILAEKYGKENIVVLTKNCYEILEMEGYKVIKCENLFHLNIFKLMKIYEQLKKYNFKKLYMFEFHRDKEGDFLLNFNFDKVYAYESSDIEKWKKRFDIKLIPKGNNKILETVYNFAKEIDGNVKRDAIKPKLHIPTKESDYIAVGIGAGADNRVTAPEVLTEFLNYIVNDQPNVKFHILGNGKNQEKYYQKLEKYIDNKNIINFVGKLNLVETVKQIAEAKLYIGFDSGLYNIAYVLDKKILAIVSLESQVFHHESPKIGLVYKKTDSGQVRNINDKAYTNENLNQIPLERFIEKYNLLK